MPSELLIHHGSSRGALCGAPSGDLTLSTDYKWVNCQACIEALRDEGDRRYDAQKENLR